MKDFPHKLKRIIEEYDSIDQFADKVGIKRQAIYNMFHGQNPSMRFIQMLLKIQPDIDLNWLLKSDEKLDPISIMAHDDKPKYGGVDKKSLISLIKKHLDSLEKILEDEC